jgi:hypothetical protein
MIGEGLNHTNDFDRTLEVVLPGSAPYGGSQQCLDDMCGENGYISRAHLDHVRHGLSSYIAALPNRTQEKGGASPLYVHKNPANLLQLADLHTSCEAYGVQCYFLVIYSSPGSWEQRSFACADWDCRNRIADNWTRCHRSVLNALGLLSSRLGPVALRWTVRMIHWSELTSVEPWHALEAWLSLPQIKVKVIDEIDSTTARSSVAMSEALKSEAKGMKGRMHRRLVIRGDANEQLSATLTVYSKYLTVPACHISNPIIANASEVVMQQLGG